MDQQPNPIYPVGKFTIIGIRNYTKHLFITAHMPIVHKSVVFHNVFTITCPFAIKAWYKVFTTESNPAARNLSRVKCSSTTITLMIPGKLLNHRNVSRELFPLKFSEITSGGHHSHQIHSDDAKVMFVSYSHQNNSKHC